MGKEIDVSELLDSRKLNRFNYSLIAISTLITLFDGLDMMLVGFAAPYISEAMHLDKAMLGTLFSVGILGMMLGSFLFAQLADRIGRRPVIIAAAFAFALLTMASGLAPDYHTLLALRFLDGLAIGGMLPVAWALNIEFAPRRMGASVVTLVSFGYSLGASIAGPVTNAIAPHYGWQGVFLACGGATLACAVALAIMLPESIRFLVTRKRQDRAAISRLLARLEPALVVGPDDRFRLTEEARPSGGTEPTQFGLRDLFRGRLKIVTPLLWIGYTASSLAIYFIASWSPMLIEAMGFARSQSAAIAASSGLAGALAGIALMRFTDRHGPVAASAYPMLAALSLAGVGVGLADGNLLLALIFVAGLLVNGSHFGILSLAGLYYPSPIRARGAGWAAGVAKIGGIAGPLIGGLLLSQGVSVFHTYGLLALCPAVLGICILGIAAALRRSENLTREMYSHG